MTTATLHYLLPEITLVAAAVAIYLGGAMCDARRLWAWLAGGALAVAAVALWWQGRMTLPDNMPVVADALAGYGRWLALATGALLLLIAAKPLVTAGTPEYVGSLVLIVAGLMLVSSARDLVLLFVALELISIPTYIMLYVGRHDTAAQEAAAKYFFLSVLASAILLYGFSFLYGAAGSTNLADVRRALLDTSNRATHPELLRLAVVLVFAGLGFRLAAVPFHFYAPDVYQGTSYPNAALLSAVPKIAALAALVRLVVMAMPVPAEAEAYAWRVALALAVMTMTLANVVALWQDDLRRLMAYSSIAQAGYMLVGLAAALAMPGVPSRWDGVGALLFYVAVYVPGSLGVFAVLAWLGRDEQPLVAADELAGLGRTRPWAAGLLAMFLFSLAGIPPLAGFWGKLLVFGSALNVGVDTASGASLRPWFVGLAMAGIVNAAVAAAYYLRLVAVMYFRTPLATPKAQGGRATAAAAWACVVLVVLLGVYPGPLVRWAQTAAMSETCTATPRAVK